MFGYVVGFVPMTDPISAKFVHPAPAHRSILTPSSLFALSVQLRLICEPDTAVATRLDGAAGGLPPVGVVAVAVFEYPELPAPLYARTR